MPASMATLGLVPGVILTIFMGFLATYCSLNVGEVKFRYPEVMDYPGIGQLMFGKAGYVYFAVSFVLLLTLTTASHVLTSVIAFNVLSTNVSPSPSLTADPRSCPAHCRPSAASSFP